MGKPRFHVTTHYYARVGSHFLTYIEGEHSIKLDGETISENDLPRLIEALTEAAALFPPRDL